MNLTAKIIKRLWKRKLATAVLVTASVAAFATLGDDGRKGLHSRTLDKYNSKNFSLKTGYDYRSNTLFSPSKPAKFIMLNTVVTYQRGNATYIVPLKKKLLLDKIKLNPAPIRY